MKKVILASGSPRRKMILELAGVPFQCITSDASEDFNPDEDRHKIPVILAERKAEKVFSLCADPHQTIVIGADTIVVLGEEILNKPRDRGEAFAMLNKLSGKKHKVITGVVLKSNGMKLSFFTITYIKFRRLSAAQISNYIEQRKPFDKAGGYAIQEEIGRIAVEEIDGSYFNVAGLPFIETLNHLERMGYTPS
ncbi:MAG: Maf family protein [Chitinophagaceae bacterium]|nr:Maf family protein [Chitinophagaceae bacterium]